MKRIVLILSLLCSITVYADKKFITESQFTANFLTYLNSQAPDYSFTIVNDLSLHTDDINGYELNIYLNNAYDVYLSGQRDINLIFNDQLASITSQKTAFSNNDVKSILPVMKSKLYIDNVKNQLKESGYSEDKLPFFLNQLNDDLYLVYVFDSAQSMRFVSTEDIKTHNIQETIHSIASKNMQQYYSHIQANITELDTNSNGRVYLFSADQNYEASIITAFDYLKDIPLDIDGNPVVFIPARNIALIVGSNDVKAINIALNLATQAYSELGYSISPFGYERVNGKWLRLTL